MAAQTPGKTLPQILLTMNAASEAQILSALAETLGMAFETPEKSKIDIEAFNHLPLDFIRKNLVLPMRIEDNALVVGMADPANVFMLDELRRKVKRDIRAVAVTGADIGRIVEALTSANADIKVDEIIKDMAEDDIQLVKEDHEDEVTDLEKIGNESPVIRFVNYLLFDALKQGASDIHIEPKEKALKIRYRIDGVLFEAMNPPHTMTGGDHVAPEDHVEPRHRRAAPAAGRPHPRNDPRPQGRPSSQHPPHAQRGEVRHAYSR